MVEREKQEFFTLGDFKGEDSFDVVKNRFSNGLEILKCIYDFFLQLAGLEESFAHGIQKLLRSASYTLHPNILMQWLGQDPYEETGSLRDAWMLIGDCLSLTAKHHLEKAYLLKQSVAEPLAEAKQGFDDIKKQNLKDTKFSSMRKLRSQLKLEESKFDGVTAELTKLRSQSNSATRTNILSIKGSPKNEELMKTIETQLIEQEQVISKLNDEFKLAERGMNLQLEYTYNTIHDSEWRRISKIRSSLIEFAKVYSNTGPVYLQYCQKLAFRMQEIDADRDIHEFVVANEKLMYSRYPKYEDSEEIHIGIAEKSSIGSSIADNSQSIRKNSAPHPLSRKSDLSPVKEVANLPSIVSKKASPPRTLDIAPPVKHSKLNKPPKSPADPSPQIEVAPDIAPRANPPPVIPSRPPKTANKSMVQKETFKSTAHTDSQPSNEKNVDSQLVGYKTDKIEDIPTPYPALPIVHKEAKKIRSNLNEIVSMQEKLIRMSEANDYYKIICGSAEDSLEHLEELRRGITKKLHPDQFAGKPELQRKATEKLSYLNTIFTDVLGKAETRRIYNILCQYRKAYSQITSQDMNSLSVAMDKLQKIYKFFKKQEVPIQLVQETEMALKLLNACIKKAE